MEQNMAWSSQQEIALDRVGRWIKNRNQPIFALGGYAGTGKTTLAKHLAAGIDGLVYFAAYTGKAAHVLQKAGAKNVSTIHKLIYKPKDKSQAKLKQLEIERQEMKKRNPVPQALIDRIDIAIATERENLKRPMFALNADESPLLGAALLVVDEYSMIDTTMGNDLMSFNVPILALGDPMQLKPVRGSPFFSGDPDYLLTEIHRQAADNPIIRMSQDVREGRRLAAGQYGDSTVVDYFDVKRKLAEKVIACDQLLVGRNATRASSNTRARELLGRTLRLPQTGDKLICLRNNSEAGLLNGQTWHCVADCMEVDDKFITLSLEGEDDERVDCLAHKAYFLGGEPDHWDIKEANSFDYGYAMTVHKSQGSQWDNVLLFDEWNGSDRRNWLYTAITRAAQRIDVVQMP